MAEDKKPWLVPGVPWKSEAAFWSWIRGVLRKGWSRHPVKIEFIEANRKRIENPVVKNRKRFPTCWGMTCAICNKDHAQKDIEIDHVVDKGVKFTGIDDVKDYVRHLFLVDFSSLRPLCKPCHKIVNHAQKLGSSFQEAALQKRVIEIMSQDKQIILDFLSERKYTGVQVSNADKRRKLVEQILREEANV